ncbi:MAG: hypothetical protein V4608_16190 [Bacteroidota bacterium]
MRIIIQNHEILAAFISRVFLGFLFFFQGYDAVFRIGIKNVIEAAHPSFANRGISKTVTGIGVVFTSYIQLIGGLFLIIGFVKYYTLYLLGLDLIFVAIAFGIIQPMWDMRFVFPRLVLLIFLLFVPWYWDVISVDYCWSFFKFLKSF